MRVVYNTHDASIEYKAHCGCSQDGRELGNSRATSTPATLHFQNAGIASRSHFAPPRRLRFNLHDTAPSLHSLAACLSDVRDLAVQATLAVAPGNSCLPSGMCRLTAAPSPSCSARCIPRHPSGGRSDELIGGGSGFCPQPKAQPGATVVRCAIGGWACVYRPDVPPLSCICA